MEEDPDFFLLSDSELEVDLVSVTVSDSGSETGVDTDTDPDPDTDTDLVTSMAWVPFSPTASSDAVRSGVHLNALFTFETLADMYPKVWVMRILNRIIPSHFVPYLLDPLAGCVGYLSPPAVTADHLGLMYVSKPAAESLFFYTKRMVASLRPTVPRILYTAHLYNAVNGIVPVRGPKGQPRVRSL
jgi:hypothetical protein